MRSAILAVLVALLTGSCGQKGALYLRDTPPPGVKAPLPEPYKPLPYPKEPAKDSGGDELKKP